VLLGRRVIDITQRTGIPAYVVFGMMPDDVLHDMPADLACPVSLRAVANPGSPPTRTTGHASPSRAARRNLT